VSYGRLGRVLHVSKKRYIYKYEHCLFPPLFASPQSLSCLIQRWQKKLRLIALNTLEKTGDNESKIFWQNSLTGLKKFGYIFLTQNPTL